MEEQRKSDLQPGHAAMPTLAVVGSLLVLLSLMAIATWPETPAQAGFESSSWPVDRAPPAASELAGAALAGQALDPLFVPDRGSLDTIAPRADRLHWRRIVPTRTWDDASPPVLALYAPYFNRVHVLAPPDYAPRNLSLRDPGFDRDRSRHALLVPLPARWDASQPVYIALEQGRRLPMRLRLESRASFAEGDIAHLRTVLPLLSVLAFIALMVAAFGAVLRERGLLHLAWALAAMLFFQGMILGEFYALPGGDRLAATGFRSLWTARALQEAFLVLFALAFFDGRKRTPRLARALLGVVTGLLLVAMLSWLPVQAYLGLLSRAGSVLLAGAVVLMLWAAVAAWRQGSREARFFLLAWLPLMVLDALRELQLLRWLRLYPDNEYLPLIATLWAAALFTFGAAERLLRVRHERDAAVDAAEHDSLTRVLNRSGILERLRLACADRRGEVAILFVDLDHFKSVNDRYGHAVGDACLNAVVKVISAELRAGDSVGRIGGEEFLLVLPAARGQEARDLAERVRARVERSCDVVDGHAVGLTLSIGVAATDEGTDRAQLLASADAAMYQAKVQGRNRVHAAQAAT